MREQYPDLEHALDDVYLTQNSRMVPPDSQAREKAVGPTEAAPGANAPAFHAAWEAAARAPRVQEHFAAAQKRREAVTRASVAVAHSQNVPGKTPPPGAVQTAREIIDHSMPWREMVDPFAPIREFFPSIKW